MDLDERAVKFFEEAEALSETDLRGALTKMREALAIEPDYPNLEDEIFLREDAITKLDGVLEFIVVLLKEDKKYQACEMLKSLPDNYIIQDKSGLVGGLVDMITKVEDLVGQARELAKSNSVKAFSISEEAIKLVPDYPGLAEDVAALTQNLTQYNSFISSIEKALKGKNPKKAGKLLDSFRENYPEDEHVRRFKVSITNLSKDLKKKKEKKINLLIIIATVGAVLAAGSGYFVFEMVTVEKAAQQWEEVHRLLAAQKFTETQVACLDINKNLGRVRLFYKSRKQELQGKVDDVLQSELVVKGAEGKVLFDGDYIPKEHLANSREVKKNIEVARALAAEENCVAAIPKFESALSTLIGMNREGSAEVIDDIKLSITGCQIYLIKDLAAKARALMSTGDHYAAAALITEAIAIVTENSLEINDPVVVKVFAVKKEISLAKFKELMATGDRFFVNGNYDEAINAYNKTHAYAKANKIGSKSLNQKIYGMINKSKVNVLIGRGDMFLAAAKWKEAAGAYESGMSLALKANLQSQPFFKQTKISLQKAKSMQLVASLDRQNKLARQYSKANQTKKARDVFKQAIKAGEASEWRGDREVAAVLAKLKRGFVEVKEKIFVDSKKKFLNDRYASILKKDFSLGADTGLFDPEVVLLAVTPELLKFSLKAMSYAKKGSRSKYSRYEATYGFDRKRKTWRLLNKSSDSKVAQDVRYN
ncbi:MAG: hypothetical protein ABFS18_00070 [Thermodesulfobacteriota bacterium]